MLLANVPAVLFGDVLARKLPLGVIRACAAAAFAVLGVLVLLKVDFGLF
jgi:putative Ca2+/H+ antiporter (TMEM165/GDT1 family)